jgi:hypothetical protein
VFLANLRDGEALIVGDDSIMPLPMMMSPPVRRRHLPDVERKRGYMEQTSFRALT